MRSHREALTFEEMAIERDRELERQRAAAEGDGELRYDFSEPLPGASVVRETAALPWGCDAGRATDYSTLVGSLISRIWYVMYALDEPRQETVRLRENTRQVLVRLAAA